VFAGCASSSGADPDARASIDASSIRPDAGIDAGHTAACPADQFATGVAANGELTCVTLDAATAEAVRSRCSIYLGWRDGCDGCTDPPTKWSRASPLDCSPGAGAGNACVSATLDDPDTTVGLATIDFDGNVNGDDKLYASIHCVAAPRDPRPAPCAPGWAISKRSGSTWYCTPVSEAAIAYVGGKCALHLGWSDSCDGCTTGPAKWGAAGDGGCSNGAGTDDTCVTTTLGGQSVNLFGLSTDGDVNGDDKFYLGLGCQAPDSAGTETKTECPAGQFVVATNDDGSFTCADPGATFSSYVRDRCSLFLGWHDSCGGCTEAPTKWGKVGLASCANGVGVDDTCGDATLGSETLPMFGLNTDGDVNDDDTMYVGFRCAP
jgi:hypothetical protein